MRGEPIFSRKERLIDTARYNTISMTKEICREEDPSRTQSEASKLSEVNPFQPVRLSSLMEQEAVFNALYTALVADTKSEVFGTLTDQAVAANDMLRGVVKQLAVSLGKNIELSPQDWLYIGVVDFVPQNLLDEWSSHAEDDRLFQITARFFQKKNNDTNPKETSQQV